MTSTPHMTSERAAMKREFLEKVSSAFASGSFLRMALKNPVPPDGKGDSGVQRILIRPVEIRGELLCSVVSRFATRDITKNHGFPEVLALVDAKLGRDFLGADLFAGNSHYQLHFGKKDRLITHRIKLEPATLEHDRVPHRRVDADARYLQSLGVTDPHGNVREKKGAKLRQIERFLDLLAAAYRASRFANPSVPQGEKALTLYDMGSGLGYLTFAAFDFFRRLEKLPVSVTGVEARVDLVTFCNRVAAECGYADLRFIQGRIDEHPIAECDILMALHACDTATDEALFAGIRAGAEIILTAPCCHKQLRPQVDLSRASGPLDSILRHGIFAERHAEIVTDTLRQLLLERAGYRVTVTEFVSVEHTAKNIMLVAVKREGALADAAKQDIDRRITGLKQLYGIKQQRLEELLLAGH